MAKRTVLLYGRTGAGKTAQIGELAEHVFETTGKKTRIYTIDKGGVETVQPYIELGIIEVVECDDTNPWIFLNKAARGFTRDTTGKWIQDKTKNAEIGLYAFESMTAFADAFMADLASQAAQNVNIGGGSNISFAVNGDGESLKISGNNMSHYNVVQTRITEEVWQSQKLDAEFVLWTASASKDDDPNSTAKVLGPEVVGKKLTAEVPRWFQLTFRIDCQPAAQGKPPKHILYLGHSLDLAAGNAVSLGNTRVPKGGGDLPPSIEPASVVAAIKKIDEVKAKAKEAIQARLKKVSTAVTK